MADPMNPAGAGAPPSGGGGGGNKQPIDPGMAEVLQKMEGFINDVNVRLDTTDDKLKKALATAEKLTSEFKQQVKESEDIEVTYKKTVELGKKLQAQNLKEYQDAKKARKELEEMVKLHEGALKNAKAGSKEAQVMSRNLTEMRRLLGDIGKESQLNEAQFAKFRDIVGETARNAQELVKAMYNLSRSGAALKGVTGVFGAMGIGKGVSRDIERHMEQIQEVRNKVKESRELRKAATSKHMMGKREKALDEMKGMAKKGGLSVDPETGQVMNLFDEKGGLTKGGRDILAKKMGFARGTKKYSQFVGGEAAMGVGKEAGAGYGEAMAGGGGAIEGVMTVFESGIEGLMVGLEAVAIPLTLLIAALEALSYLFETYVKQNQEMEKSIGKGGLFTQPGVGAGTAFMQARTALNPKFGAGTTMLGMNFERNLAVAGAMANQGFASAQGLGIGETGPGAANLAPGAMGEFMKGGVGEVQRIVMGAGRVGGLTDQEGVEQVLKLLSEYRETMASSEEFMSKVNKDTAAAGISTTKYLKIIDDVSSHFDKMGKSLDQVTGVMRELSRYGSISSESLKDMMEFLSSGQAQTTPGNMATAAFTQSIMPKDILDSLREAQKSTLSNYVDEYNDEAKLHGMKPMNIADIQGAIGKNDFAGAQSMANAMRGDINKVTDPTVKQSMTDALTKIQDQINRVSGVMSPDFLKRASSQGLYGENQADVLAQLLTNIRGSSQFAGVSIASLMAGGGTAPQQLLLQQLAEQLGIKGTPAQIFQPLRDVAQSRVEDLKQDTPTQRKMDARLLFGEIYRGAKTKQGIATFLTQNGIGKELFEGAKTADDVLDSVASSDEGIAELQNLFGKNLDLIAGSKETQHKLLSSTTQGNKQGADALADQLTQARGIATRTQSVGDLLSNTFKPLLIKLIGAIEGIATTVTKWFGSTKEGQGQGDLVAKTEAQQQKEMEGVNDAVTELNSNLDSRLEYLKNFQKEHTDKTTGKMDDAYAQKANDMAQQIAIGTDMLNKLEDIQQKGTFTSGAQESLVMDAIAKLNATGNATNLQGAGFKGITVNNYYSSSVTQDTTPSTGGNASPQESAQTPKAPAVTRTNR